MWKDQGITHKVRPAYCTLVRATDPSAGHGTQNRVARYFVLQIIEYLGDSLGDSPLLDGITIGRACNYYFPMEAKGQNGVI